MRLRLSRHDSVAEKFNILLVTAYPSFSLAAAYFYENLKRKFAGCSNVQLIVRNYGHSTGEVDYSFIRDILLLRPEVIGFSNFFWNFEANCNLAALAKSLVSDTFVVFGGPQASDLEEAQKILNLHKAVNAVLCGEADFSFPELVSNLYFAKKIIPLPGLALNDRSSVQIGLDAYFVRDLSELPLVYHPNSEYVLACLNRRQAIPLETLRGCRDKCSYCLYNVNALRFRPLKMIEKEISFLCASGAKYVRICDSHFAGSRARAMEIFDLIKYYNDGNTAFYIYPDPDHLDGKYLNVARKANCRIISLGIETMDPKVGKAVDRRINQSRTKGSLDMLRKSGSNCQIDLMFGLPEQTLESFVKDIISLKVGGSDNILFSPLMIFPGTKLSRTIDSKQISILDTTPQKYGYSNAMGKEGYAKAFLSINLFSLLNILRRTTGYLFSRLGNGKEYKKHIRHIFSNESVERKNRLIDLFEDLNAGSDYIMEHCDHIVKKILEFWTDAIGYELDDDNCLTEITRLDLFEQAMKARYSELSRDIYYRKQSRKTLFWEDLKDNRMGLAENVWLEKFGFPSKTIFAEGGISTIPEGNSIFCVFDCSFPELYYISKSEFLFLESFTKPSKISDLLSGGSNENVLLAKKWAGHGILVPQV